MTRYAADNPGDSFATGRTAAGHGRRTQRRDRRPRPGHRGVPRRRVQNLPHGQSRGACPTAAWRSARVRAKRRRSRRCSKRSKPGTHRDAAREVGPLARAPDAVDVATDGLTIDEVVERLVELGAREETRRRRRRLRRRLTDAQHRGNSRGTDDEATRSISDHHRSGVGGPRGDRRGLVRLARGQRRLDRHAGRSRTQARTDGPLASLVGARDAIRKLKAAGPLQQPIRVHIQSGEYAVREPVVFEPQDSGTEQCPISYVGDPGDAADHLRRQADHRLAEAGRPLGRASARGGGGPVDLRRAVGQRRAPDPGANAERGLFLYGGQGSADHRPEDRQTGLQRPRRVPLQAGRHSPVQPPRRRRGRRVPVMGGRPSADCVGGRGEARRHLPESAAVGFRLLGRQRPLLCRERARGAGCARRVVPGPQDRPAVVYPVARRGHDASDRRRPRRQAVDRPERQARGKPIRVPPAVREPAAAAHGLGGSAAGARRRAGRLRLPRRDRGRRGAELLGRGLRAGAPGDLRRLAAVRLPGQPDRTQ